jgi:bacterioferritin
MPETPEPLSRKALIALLSEDLSREFQAVIAYVVYSQTLKGAQYMAIARELDLATAVEQRSADTRGRKPHAAAADSSRARQCAE